MKRILLILLATVMLVPVFTLLGCDNEDATTTILPPPPVALSEEQVLYGWKGNYFSLKHSEALTEYISSYTPISCEDESGVFIKADFKVKSASVRVFIPSGFSDTEITDCKDYLAEPTVQSESYVYVDIGWCNRAENGEKEYKTLSYLITLKDENNEKHHYYFRVNYKTPSVSVGETVAGSAIYDIDGDGKEELCQIILRYDDEDMQTYRYIVISDKETGEEKYPSKKEFHRTGLQMDYCFFAEGPDNELMICFQTRSDNSADFIGTRRYFLAVKDGEIIYEDPYEKYPQGF